MRSLRPFAAGAAVAAALLLGGGRAGAADVAATSCTICHSNADLFDEASIATVKGYTEDIHASVGLSCHDCHGGNPDPALAEDLDAAMSDTFAPNPCSRSISLA